MTHKSKRTPTGLLALLRDIRVLQVIVQIVFIILLVTGLSVIWVNILNTLTERRLSIYFEVLTPPAGFNIGEAPDWYSSSDSFGRAFTVGIYNTLRIVFPGLFFATLFGVFIGIFLLSRNWLIRNISRVYVEVLRNTPLLVQLYFWYFVVMFGLPQQREAIGLPAEGMAFIPYRLPVYGLLILLAWWYSTRASFPGRVTGGALAGVIVLEVALRLGDASGLNWVVGGGLSAIMLLVAVFGSKLWRNFSYGYFIIVGGQLLLSGLYLQLAHYLDILPSLDTIVSEIAPVVYLSRRGTAFPELLLTPRFADWLAFVLAGAALAVALWVIAGHVTETTGRPIARVRLALLSVLGAAALGWFVVTAQPVPTEITVGEPDALQTLPYDQAYAGDLITPAQEAYYARDPFITVLPERTQLAYTRGTVLTPEYMALLIGLIIYTSAFIAEIVRAGIQAVPYGQLEAARALGLSYAQTLQLIILPQALRVIIPPLGNQYLNLSKNSSLAIAVAYADVYSVGVSMMNTSGQSIVGFAVIFLVYITMSLVISFFMNVVNARFQLVTR
jgi:general L-amino acid transport system permease protein